MVSCDLSWQIPSLFINTGKKTLSDSQWKKKRVMFLRTHFDSDEAILQV